MAGLIRGIGEENGERDAGDRGEGITERSIPSIIDYELNPPEAPDVNQAV